jgi:hypothetical protein
MKHRLKALEAKMAREWMIQTEAQLTAHVGGANPSGNDPNGWPNTNLWTWTAGAAAWTKIVPAPPIPADRPAQKQHPVFCQSVSAASDPHCRPRQPGRQSREAVGRRGPHMELRPESETQVTWDNQIAISTTDDFGSIGEHFDPVLNDMKFDPNFTARLAVGASGAFMTIDGVNWARLLHIVALGPRLELLSRFCVRG